MRIRQKNDGIFSLKNSTDYDGAITNTKIDMIKVTALQNNACNEVKIVEDRDLRVWYSYIGNPK